MAPLISPRAYKGDDGVILEGDSHPYGQRRHDEGIVYEPNFYRSLGKEEGAFCGKFEREVRCLRVFLGEITQKWFKRERGGVAMESRFNKFSADAEFRNREQTLRFYANPLCLPSLSAGIRGRLNPRYNRRWNTVFIYIILLMIIIENHLNNNLYINKYGHTCLSLSEEKIEFLFPDELRGPTGYLLPPVKKRLQDQVPEC